MTDIIPSINVPTFEEVVEKIAKVEPLVEWCHLDVTDGVFSGHLTWHDPRDLPRLQTKLKVEAHLMVQEPEKVVPQWLVSPVKRVIVHIEAVRDLDFILEKCREAGVEMGLALNPETPWQKAEPWFGKVHTILALEVHPGPSGQPIAPDAFEKIASIRKACPECIIEFDGGVNPETAKKAREAGANLLVIGAYIFGSKSLEEAIASL